MVFVSPLDLQGLAKISKPELREYFRDRRRDLDIPLISAQICTHLLSSDSLLKAQLLLAYLPLKAEIDLQPLFSLLPEKIWGIPRCLPGAQLSWHPFDQDSQLVRNGFGILEPSEHMPRIDPNGADLVLVPALVCDRWGRRLGYGGGYYDRFLAAYPRPTLGIVPQACLVPEPLPQDPWDRLLEGVVTETGVYRSRGSLGIEAQ